MGCIMLVRRLGRHGPLVLHMMFMVMRWPFGAFDGVAREALASSADEVPLQATSVRHERSARPNKWAQPEDERRAFV